MRPRGSNNNSSADRDYPVVSSPDGRYLAAGPVVFDLEQKKGVLLQGDGNRKTFVPAAIRDDCAAYGAVREDAVTDDTEVVAAQVGLTASTGPAKTLDPGVNCASASGPPQGATRRHPLRQQYPVDDSVPAGDLDSVSAGEFGEAAVVVALADHAEAPGRAPAVELGEQLRAFCGGGVQRGSCQWGGGAAGTGAHLHRADVPEGHAAVDGGRYNDLV